MAVIMMLLPILISPAPAFAQNWPDTTDVYLTSREAYRVYDMDGVLVATYRGLGIAFTSQADNVVEGEIDLYTVGSIYGTYVLDGTGNVTLPRRIIEGDNTIQVVTFGTHQIILPTGVEGIATSGTATVTGSPLALAQGGTRDIPTTGPGSFILTIQRVYTTIGTFSGVIGEGAKPRLQVVGTQIYATATEDGATVTGSPVKCIPATTTLDVSAAGTIDIEVPYGMVGTATSGTATVTNSPVTLPGGATTEITTGVTTGTVTIGLQVAVGYNISGYFGIDLAGDIAWFRGRFDGFIITDQVNWTTYMINRTIKANLGTRPT